FLMDDSKRMKGAMVILGAICLSWLGLYLYLNFHSEIVSDFIAVNYRDGALPKPIGQLTVGVLTSLQRQVILSFAIFSLLLLAKTGKIRTVLFSVLLLAVVYVDLTWAHKSYLFPIHPDKLLASPPIIEPAQTQQNRLFYYPSANDLHPAYFSVRGQPTFEQAVALSYQNYLPNVGTLYGIDYFQEIDALGRRGYSDFLRVANGLPLERQIKLLGTFNVKYLVSFRDLPEKNLTLVRQFPQYFSWLYEIKSVVPRAYSVIKFTVEKDSAKVLQRLSATDFDPLHQVILDSEVSLATSAASAQVHIQRYENGVVAIATAANGESLLVLADAYYPGWKAYIDGTETAIFRANHFYRAVRLPGGEHQVEFRYEPRSFKIGAMISLATVLL
ncbi:MAG TPA: YfhO family protein, partial [Saprospiraceae bacterium]|nr:YfhO family protein [Saprospiraceae bacterium]